MLRAYLLTPLSSGCSLHLTLQLISLTISNDNCTLWHSSLSTSSLLSQDFVPTEYSAHIHRSQSDKTNTVIIMDHSKCRQSYWQSSISMQHINCQSDILPLSDMWEKQMKTQCSSSLAIDGLEENYDSVRMEVFFIMFLLSFNIDILSQYCTLTSLALVLFTCGRY
jgi:hypothetical protein